MIARGPTGSAGDLALGPTEDLDRQCRPVEAKGRWLWEVEVLENDADKKNGVAVRDRHAHLARDDFEEVALAQNGRGRTRSRSRSPRRRRTRRGNDRREDRAERSRGHWEWQASQASSSYRKLPPWRAEPEEGWDDWRAGTSSGSGLRRETREPGLAKAKAKAALSNPTPSSAPDIRSVAIIPTLEQCGPTVRFWSDVCEFTDPMNSSANRSVLTDASIGSIVDTLSAMNQVERAGLYVGLIRFLGIMWADIMRAITIAENNDDMEALLQTRVHRKRPPAQKREMPEMMENLAHTEDATGFMQVLSKTTAVTFFGSRMAMLQAHLESMETRQAARISRMLQARLQLWRNRWTMGMRSVSRDRVERFCAALTAYEIEGDDSMAGGDDADWADKQWKYLEEHLAIDAVLLANAMWWTMRPCHTHRPSKLREAQGAQWSKGPLASHGKEPRQGKKLSLGPAKKMNGKNVSSKGNTTRLFGRSTKNRRKRRRLPGPRSNGMTGP